MPVRDLRIPLIIVVFLIVVTLGVGARSLYYEMRVVDPMASLAAEVPGVRSVEVTPEKGGSRDVVVELEGGIRLEEVYHEMERRAAETLGSSFGRLVLKDQRTPELIEGFYRIHYSLQEGITTGRFSEMAREVEATLSEAGFEEHRIFVGERHLFVQIHAPSGEYLYEALPRSYVQAYGAGEGGSFLW